MCYRNFDNIIQGEVVRTRLKNRKDALAVFMEQNQLDDNDDLDGHDEDDIGMDDFNFGEHVDEFDLSENNSIVNT